MNDRVWVMAALTAIAGLGMAALTLAYENQAAIASVETTDRHIAEDITELKDDVEVIGETVQAIDKRLFYLCRASAHECPP